jgi:hypothetical protein
MTPEITYQACRQHVHGRGLGRLVLDRSEHVAPNFAVRIAPLVVQLSVTPVIHWGSSVGGHGVQVSA